MKDYAAYYSNLLIWQYRTKPKIKTLVENYVNSVQLFDNLEDLRTAFDLKTATKAQLLRIAEFVGVPLTNSIINLSDNDLRKLIFLKTIINNSNGSSYSINLALFEIFGYDLLMTSDDQMHMFYFASFTNNVLDIAIDNNLLPRPAGVSINIIDTEKASYQLVNSNDLNDISGIDSIGSDGLGTFFSTNEIINY